VHAGVLDVSLEAAIAMITGAWFGVAVPTIRGRYADLKVTGRTISFSVEGTGCDTPQLYIGCVARQPAWWHTASRHPV
jgi:hypothetical protein